jgi:hypothetical protein
MSRCASPLGRITVALAIAVALMACESPRKAGAPEPAPEPLPDDPVLASIVTVARERASHMKAEGEPHRGELREGQTRDLALVLKDPFCYALLGAAGDGAQDLSLLLFDPTGVPVQKDASAGRQPTLGLAEPLCPPAPGLYRLEVRMVKGAGPFALGVYYAE